MLKAVTHQGRDISDAPIELGSGEELTDVEVVISSRVTVVGGRLEDERQQPIRDATVVVFDADTQTWFESSRRVRAIRPEDGQWQLKGLPSGEYLAVALDYVEDGAWNDPRDLEALKQDATKVTIGDGSSHTIALKLVIPKQ